MHRKMTRLALGAKCGFSGVREFCLTVSAAAVSVASFYDVFDPVTGTVTDPAALSALTAAAGTLALAEVA